MGKSQKKKSMRRHNPVRVPDSHLPKGLASAESGSSKKEAVLPIIQKMESPDSAERKWACVAVSNLIQNDPSTRRLLQGNNVVGALITRLTDSEEEVVVEAAGSLRNLCIDGGFEICAEMFNKNILAPLKSCIPKIHSSISLSENVITIFWCLSETSNKALAAINEINLVPVLMSFLAASDKLPISSVLAAAQCLYVLTDDNRPAIAEVKAEAGYLSTLLSIVKLDPQPNQSNIATLKVLAAGTLRNCAPLPAVSTAAWPNLDQDLILPVLAPIINNVSLPDITDSVQSLIVTHQSEPQLPTQPKNGPQTDHKSESLRALENLEDVLRTTQLALEILTDTNATLPEVEEGGDDNDSDVEADAMNVDETDSSTIPRRSVLPPLVHPLLHLIQPTALSFPPLASPSIHPPTTSALSALHIAALECLNNIFLALAVASPSNVSEDKETGLKVWNTLWQALELVGTETGLGQERRFDFWSMAVGVLWAVGIIWKGNLVPTEGQVSVLITLFNSSTADERLRVKCVGALECLAQHPESIAANKEISGFFLSLLVSDTNAGTEPIIQAVSALIDIYSDELMPYDVNFRDGGYLNQLIDSVDRLKKAIKAIDRHKEGGRDLRRRGDETRQNLLDFIQYRRNLRL